VRPLDWGVFVLYLVYIVVLGSWWGRGSRTTRDYFLAGRSMSWWAIGLSVMATQASAITFIGTTGQGYVDGMRFVQFYFGLPVAMVILCVTLVPLFYRAKVYTAYEYLEQRFDAKTRFLSAILFLLSRGLALGVVIYAPSVVLSILLGWDIAVTVAVMTAAAAAYTILGGIRAVIWTDVQQMILLLGALAICPFIIFWKLPADLSLGDTLSLAGITHHLKAVDLSPDPTNKYTLWSGLIAGTFLMLSYFGCDQSQVQRYLTSRSLRDSRLSLLLSAFVKIPMQFLILFIGVLVFVFYQFIQPPLAFDPATVQQVRESRFAEQYRSLEERYGELFSERKTAAQTLVSARNTGDSEGITAAEERYRDLNNEVDLLLGECASLMKKATGSETDYNDTNYIFPGFIIRYLPTGLVGLFIAAVFAAAMSSMDSELNSLSTATVIDVYKRHIRPDAGEGHYLVVSRLATVFWAVIAGFYASYAGALGSVIEAVNRIGSYFYGSILGVFVLAVGLKRANGNGAFAGLFAGMTAVWLINAGTDIAFLWLNIVGCVAVVAVGLFVSLLTGGNRPPGAGEADQVGEEPVRAGDSGR